MSAGRDLSIGIAGWGRAGGELHARALRGLAGARIAAVADCDARARARAAGVVGPERVFDDPRRLLEDPSLDAIALCMPVRGRAPIALEALAGGRPLFIEKPLALSLEESDRLVAAAARMGRIEHHTVFHAVPSWRAIPATEPCSRRSWYTAH